MSMRPEAVELFKAAKQLHKQVVETVSKLRDETKTCHDLEDLADLAFCCEKTKKFLDEMSTLVSQLGALNEKQACALWVALDTGERSIKTMHVTAVPNIRTLTTLPRQSTDPERYAMMMDDLGVPRHLWEGHDHPVVQGHWPGLIDEISRRLAAGKPLPRGIDPDKTFPEYTLHLRGKKGPDE